MNYFCCSCCCIGNKEQPEQRGSAYRQDDQYVNTNQPDGTRPSCHIELRGDAERHSHQTETSELKRQLDDLRAQKENLEQRWDAERQRLEQSHQTEIKELMYKKQLDDLRAQNENLEQRWEAERQRLEQSHRTEITEHKRKLRKMQAEKENVEQRWQNHMAMAKQEKEALGKEIGRIMEENYGQLNETDTYKTEIKRT